MTHSHRPRTGFRIAAPAAALAVAASLGGCIGTTYGTGEYPEAAIFREVTGGVVGMVTRKKPKEQIDYAARAPLVEPPEPQLQPPIQTASLSDPNWPVDPDKTERPDVSDEITPEYRENLKGLKVLSRTRRVGSTQGTWRDSGVESPAEFHANQKARKTFTAATAEAQGVGVGPGKRQYLTQPPEDYGVPAETAPTQFEDIKKKKKGWFFGWFGGA